MPVTPLVAVVGATATGKSDLALELAEALAARGPGAEVVNADAMQLYRGMDVGTAKLPVAQRRGVPHHLLDVLEVTDEASVAAYQRHVRAVVDDVGARGRVPVLVGGSGLYVRAALEPLRIPPTDAGVRNQARENSYLVLSKTQFHPRLSNGWESEPAALSETFKTKDGKVRLVKIVQVHHRHSGDLMECELKIDEG